MKPVPGTGSGRSGVTRWPRVPRSLVAVIAVCAALVLSLLPPAGSAASPGGEPEGVDAPGGPTPDTPLGTARRVLVFICHEAGEPAQAKRQLAALSHLVNATRNPLFEAVFEKLVSDGVGVSSEVLVAEHRAAAERMFQRLGFAPETLGGSKRSGTTGPGADSGAWWNQTTDPGFATSDQETVVAMPESALLIEDTKKKG